MNTPLPREARVVIVGGGIHGLSCAFNLNRLGVRDVLVLDAGYWQGGASGRNGSLIRNGFATSEWTRLFRYSTQEWHKLSRTLGHNVMFSRRGYTMIAETDQTAAMFERAADVHRKCDVKSELLNSERLRTHLPAIDRRRVKSALNLVDGGIAPHHAAMKAYRAACEARGVVINYRTAVTGFERTGARISAVHVGDQRIETDSVVVAAGAHNLVVAEMAGVSLPGYAMRIEAMALEPIRPLIRPALALIDRLCYLHQTARGEIVGGTEIPERPRMSLRADLPVMTATARVYVDLFPRLAELRILRHWAGMIHITPDFGPLIGEHPELKDLWFSAGWSYGWAGGPGAGALLARAIAKGELDERIRPFALDRFKRGKPINETAIVLSKFD
ncbi:MAG TPA: FAD-binding oxidoreductase [Alphaproteobacteria bacterium]|nr:FAD-binding oxidoreductase [Alphaproteobacteria bacterium]